MTTQTQKIKKSYILRELIDKIIKENGNGHKALEKALEEGTITTKEAEIILFRVHTILLNQSVEKLSELA